MNYRLLLPIDDDEGRAVAQARTAARLPAADREVQVTVLHVCDDPHETAETTVRELSSGAAAIEELGRHDVTVETMLGSGDPAAEILAAAEEIGADQIVVGGRKRSPLGSVLFGSVTQAVIRDATRPVTVTGDTPPEEPSHVCQSCGERYYTGDGSAIETCRACGGTKVELVA